MCWGNAPEKGSANARSRLSSVSITLDVYSHLIPGLGDAAAIAMEDALADDLSVGDEDAQ